MSTCSDVYHSERSEDLLDRSFVPILGTQDDIVLIIPELFPLPDVMLNVKS